MKLKVWGGITHGETRTVVCAPSKKRAVELLNKYGFYVTMGILNGFWCITGNEAELRTATEEGVWVEVTRWSEHYKRVTRRVR